MNHRKRPWDLHPGYSPSVPGTELLDELAAGGFTIEDPVPFVLSDIDRPARVSLTVAGEAAAILSALDSAGLLDDVEPGIMAATWRLAADCAHFDGAPPGHRPPAW